MSRATPRIRAVAVRLVAYEAKANRAAAADLPAALHVCAKLGPHLATLMGKAGFRAILASSLAVAQADSPWLRHLQVTAGGVLEIVNTPEAGGKADKPAESIALVAQLLGLLVAFIGENLTQRLICEVWPKLTLEDLNFTKGDSHEEA